MNKLVIALFLGQIKAINLEQTQVISSIGGTFGYLYPQKYSDDSQNFVQMKSGSACQNSGVPGVNCLPNNEFWLEGMDGDEDLGEAITMKGEKFLDDDKNNQKMVQTDVQDDWMGYTTPTSSYNPLKTECEGYFSLKTNNADSDCYGDPFGKNDVVAWDIDLDKIGSLGTLYGDLDYEDTEKVSEMNVQQYQYGANFNFFGPRTTFYGQLDSSLDNPTQPYYNQKVGLWMQMPMEELQTQNILNLAQNEHTNHKQHHHKNHNQKIQHRNLFAYDTPNPNDKRPHDQYNPVKLQTEGFYHQNEYYFPDSPETDKKEGSSRRNSNVKKDKKSDFLPGFYAPPPSMKAPPSEKHWGTLM